MERFDGIGCGHLSRDESIPARGNIRHDIADAARGIVDTGKYRRGFGRGQRKPFVQFLRIAQGSLKELETHTLLAMSVGLLDEKSAGLLSVRFEKLGKMMRSFIRSLEVSSSQ
jgi:four helix bundle protein